MNPTPSSTPIAIASPSRPRSRRASAAVVMIIVLVILQLAVIGAIAGSGGGNAQALTASRLDAVRAFYAAESGMNMSIREIMLATDADGDGAIGGISDDGNPANDPNLGGGARVHVARAVAGSDVTLTSRASAGEARRVVQATLE